MKHYKNIYLEVTPERIDIIQQKLNGLNGLIFIVIWLNEDDRNIGECEYIPVINKTLKDVINQEYEIEKGGCIEICIDEWNNISLYHKEDDITYFNAIALEKLKIFFKETKKDKMLSKYEKRITK